MLKIRLQRVGRKHDPSFRVVVTDSRFAAKSGKALEVLGSYNPRFNNPTLKEDRIKEWIGKGAQASGTVHNILVGAGIIKGKKVNVLPKKSPIKKEGEDLNADESASVKEGETEAPVATEEATPAEGSPVEEKTEEALTEKAKEETEAAPENEEKKEDTPASETPSEEETKAE
ncbi:MAG: 30S ribosomal protein S16 [Parcubacteria group bacterium]|nr:30S ribosomal protein S16 [Parcubacteria group bacterium]